MANFYDLLEEFQDALLIRFISTEIIEESEAETGYVVTVLDEYESEVEDILDDFGFKRIFFEGDKNFKGDLFICPLETFALKADEDSYDKIRLQHSKYYIQRYNGEFSNFRIEMAAIWEEIRNEIYDINNLCIRHKKINKEIFLPTQNVLDSSLKISNMISINDESFGEYCWRLYVFGYESVYKRIYDDSDIRECIAKSRNLISSTPDIILQYLNDYFRDVSYYQNIKKLRHYYIHVNSVKYSEVTDCIYDFIKKPPSNPVEYFILQKRLTSGFQEFLVQFKGLVESL